MHSFQIIENEHCNSMRRELIRLCHLIWSYLNYPRRKGEIYSNEILTLDHTSHTVHYYLHHSVHLLNLLSWTGQNTAYHQQRHLWQSSHIVKEELTSSVCFKTGLILTCGQSKSLYARMRTHTCTNAHAHMHTLIAFIVRRPISQNELLRSTPSPSPPPYTP